MSSIRKIIAAESAAYQKHVEASAAVVDRVTQGLDDDLTARLRRRSAAYQIQWLAAARKLEEINERVAL